MKKNIIRLAKAIVAAIISSAVFFSCGPEEQPGGGGKNVSVTGVSLNKTSLSLSEGESENLTVTVSPSDATNKSVSWKSSDSGVATVDGNGKVTAVKDGTTTITVTTYDGSKTATCSVTVKAIPLTKIEVLPSKADVTIGTPLEISVKFTPANASNQKVTWSSSNTEIATVSDLGIVEGVKEGKATITATSAEGGFKASCEVTVVAITKAGVYWSQDRIIFRDGNSLGINSYYNSCIDLEGTVYYYADNKFHVSGVPVYQYSCSASGYYTAAGGGYFFIEDVTDNSNISVWKVNPTKRTAKKVSIHKGKKANEIWVYDMAADTDGNLYIAGKIANDNDVDIATLWKLDTSDKVTVTSLSDGTGIAKGPAVDAVALNKNGDVFCLVYEGTYGSGGYYKEYLYKNGKKQYQITENCSRSYSQPCDLAVNGNDVYMSICEKAPSGEDTLIKVYKNKNVIYTLKKGDGRTYAGDISVTSNGDVYCLGHSGSGENTEYCIWKNGKVVYLIKGSLIPHCVFVKE